MYLVTLAGPTVPYHVCSTLSHGLAPYLCFWRLRLLLMFAPPLTPHSSLNLLLPYLPCLAELDLQRALSLQTQPVKEGPLFIHRTKGKGPLTSSSFKKLYFSLTTEALSFGKTPSSKVDKDGGGQVGL